MRDDIQNNIDTRNKNKKQYKINNNINNEG